MSRTQVVSRRFYLDSDHHPFYLDANHRTFYLDVNRCTFYLDFDHYVEATIADLDAPLVGDTEEIIDGIAEFRSVCGYDDFVLFLQFNIPGLTHEDHLEQLRAFANDVVPYFRE